MSAGDPGAQPGQPGPYWQQGQYGQPGSYGPPGPYGQPGLPAPPRRTNTLAIVALCCGIGFVIAGPFASIPALILGSMSIRQIERTGEDGRGMAITGVILGIVGLVVSVLLVVLFVAFWNHVSTLQNQYGS